MQKEICPECKSEHIIKKGSRKTKLQIIQRYKCKSCSKIFSINGQSKFAYSIKVILESISFYNLGYTQSEVIQILNRKFKINVPPSTLSSWINRFKPHMPYHRIREQCMALYTPSSIIYKKPLNHKQVYKFQYHNAKLDLAAKLSNKFMSVKNYIQYIHSDKFPHHIFHSYPDNQTNDRRASKIKFDLLNINGLVKNNCACVLAGLALNFANNNYQRHSAVQEFMLKNDTSSIAIEMPVYLTKNDLDYFHNKNFSIDLSNYKTPLTGHIDILQIRNGLVHILDYKPDAQKEMPIEQLTLYALALASRTKLALMDFKCAWFNENNYYEFFPLHAVYELENKKKFIKNSTKLTTWEQTNLK